MEGHEPASRNGQELTDPLADVMPWYGPVSTALATLGLVALLTAAILLATPAANAFFRAPGSAGPPMPGTGYPTGGQYPGHPQGPATQGYPPAQGRPGLNGIGGIGVRPACMLDGDG